MLGQVRGSDPNRDGFRAGQLHTQRVRPESGLVSDCRSYWGISAWAGVLAFRGREVRRWEPKRLRLRLFSVPAASRHARQEVVRVKELAASALWLVDAVSRQRDLVGPAPGCRRCGCVRSS